MIGDGLAIAPESGLISAPVSGVVTSLFDSGHAMVITDESGTEILLHVGINTVVLRGRHFRSYVRQGDSVKIGDPLVTADLENLKTEGIDPTVIVVLPELPETAFPEKTEMCQVERGERLMRICE